MASSRRPGADRRFRGSPLRPLRIGPRNPGVRSLPGGVPEIDELIRRCEAIAAAGVGGQDDEEAVRVSPLPG